MRITIECRDFGGGVAFRVQTADFSPDCFALCVTDAARKFGRQWSNHFVGSKMDAYIMAGFAIGVAEKAVEFNGRDIIARVEA